MTKLKADEAVLGLAASVTDRACELIMDGWTKGKMRSGAGGVENFCIHGALDLAMEEMFGVKNRRSDVQQDVESVATAFICDEALGGNGIKHWAAGFNDASERKHDEVTGALDRAANRLWALAVPDESSTETFTYSKYADLDEETAQQFLNASLN